MYTDKGKSFYSYTKENKRLFIKKGMTLHYKNCKG